MITDLVVMENDPSNEIKRSVELTNEEWAILAMCIEAYADTYRTRHSQTVTTYVTRGQLDNAVAEAAKMNQLLQSLDNIQAKLL
jgi:hypothetical protein